MGVLDAPMRIGQILLDAELINPVQLSEGLEYGAAKGIFLGRAMELLKHLTDDHVSRAVRTQKLIRMGLSPLMAIDALKTSLKEGISLEQALQNKNEQAADLHANLDEEHPDFSTVNLEADTPEEMIRAGDNLLILDLCAKAEKLYLRAFKALEREVGPGHIDLCPVLVRIGNTNLALHSFSRAKDCYDKVLEIRTEALGDTHPQVAKAHESLSDLYKAQGEDDKALECSLLALDIFEQNLPSQLSSYASILKKMAAAAKITQEQKERPLPVGEILRMAELLSEGELKTALKMSKQLNQPLGLVLRENCMIGDRDLQSALKAQFCVRQGVLSEKLAIDLLKRACRRGISLERLLHEAGVMASDEGKFAIYRQIAADLDLLVAAESSSVGSQNQKELAPIAYRLGSLYEQVGDQPQAETYYSRALKIWGGSIQGDLTAAKTCTSLAKIFQSQNRLEEAVPMLVQALELRQEVLGNSHEETIETLEDAAEMQIELGHPKSALANAQLALSSREELGQSGVQLFRAVIMTGDAYVLAKNYESAQAAYQRAMALARNGSEKPTIALAAVMEKLGDMYKLQDMVKVATPLYKSAVMIYETEGKAEGKAFELLKAKATADEQQALEST